MTETFAANLSASGLPDDAIELVGLTKTYAASRTNAPKEALKDVSLRIPRGSIFGLLGPNGAGKSTLINILAGLVTKTSGAAYVWGREIAEASRFTRAALGIVPQELNLDAFFTPWELLDQQAGLYGVPKRERRTDELLAAVDLTAQANAYARTMSGGMRRRLMVAKAMVHTPPVLVLDEPTAGVDVELRRSLWDYVRRLNEAGTTILLTTHYLEEAEQLCDHIAIINQGELVANDTKANLLARMDSKRIVLTLGRDMPEMPAALKARGWSKPAPNKLSLTYKPSLIRIGQELLTIQALGYTITDMTTHEPDLETVFLQLTHGRPALEKS